jgi:hypothetical protein
MMAVNYRYNYRYNYSNLHYKKWKFSDIMKSQIVKKLVVFIQSMINTIKIIILAY